MKKLLINTPTELLGSLKEIFPEYAFEVDEDDTLELNYHALLQDFIYFYGKNNSIFTKHQIKNFSEIVNLAIEAGGNLENAFGTCVLEHLGQIDSREPLVSFLSRAAKERLHA